MPQPLADALDDVRTLVLDPQRLIRAVAAGRRRHELPTFRRAELRWVRLRDELRLQVVSYDDRQAFTSNATAAEADAVVDELLSQPYANWHVETTDATIQLRVTKRGEAQVHRGSAPVAERERRPEHQHDRRKQRMLDPGDRYLRAVGISDEHGRVKPSRQAKYKQVEEFLRALEPVLDDAARAAGDDAVRVVDLGCGNAYLSFAGYQWLRERAVAARLTGVDVKAQARERNAALATELGWSADVSFVEATIDDVALDQRPHLVLALHACDTATDDALARAVEWDAPVILAAPCCHHDIQRQLGGAGEVPDPYGLVVRHGILRERMADVLTDAARAAILRLLGYRVEVIEFVDSAHTPRNALIRAVYTGAAPSAEVVADYRRLVGDWAIEPALAVRLRDRLAEVVD